MTEYRHRTTGEIKSQGAWRKEHPNTSFPRVWTDATLDFLEIDPVFETPKPTPGKYENVRRNGVEQDAKGNWVQAWEVVPMFADDETGTKAEKEAEYQARLDANAASAIRSRRDALLAATDWTALSDVTMSDAMATYRQALRDISEHANFPYLEDADWPTKP